jgi:hypothetical protein
MFGLVAFGLAAFGLAAAMTAEEARTQHLPDKSLALSAGA